MNNEKIMKRSGDTKITSVSVSEAFQKLIDEHNLSPTECFRRGVAVTLFDMGVGMYQSTKNENRSKFMKEFLQRIDTDEEIEKDYKNMQLFEDLQKQFIKIKKIIEEIEK